MDQIAKFLPTPAEPPIGEYEPADRGELGQQLYALYPNGYGASIIQGPYSYGGTAGLYEIAVLHGSAEIGDGSLCYSTPVTSDVIGSLTAEAVVIELHKIAALPRNEECNHHTPHEEADEDRNVGMGEMLDSYFGMLGARALGAGDDE